MMRLLADESVDFAIIRALCAAGFDVQAVAETHPGAPDVEVMARAYREERVLLTEDKDFGQLVCGSALLRHPVRGGVTCRVRLSRRSSA